MLEIDLSNQFIVKALLSVGTILLTRSLVKLFFAKRGELVRDSYRRTSPRQRRCHSASNAAQQEAANCIAVRTQT